MDRPVVLCFMAEPLTKRDSTGVWWAQGHVVSTPIAVPFTDEEIAKWRKLGMTLIGPDPVGMADLAKWERDQGSHS